jgi:hypothetical protein
MTALRYTRSAVILSEAKDLAGTESQPEILRFAQNDNYSEANYQP